MQTVQEALGHADIKSTQRYAHMRAMPGDGLVEGDHYQDVESLIDPVLGAVEDIDIDEGCIVCTPFVGPIGSGEAIEW